MRSKSLVGGPSMFGLADLKVGDSYSFDEIITDEDLDTFASLCGDYSPIHISYQAALEAGFPGRVVHGALLNSFISRLIGMHMPGFYSVIATINLRFRAPVIVNTPIKIAGEVTNISGAARAIIMKVKIVSSDALVKFVSGELTIRLRDE